MGAKILILFINKTTPSDPKNQRKNMTLLPWPDGTLLLHFKEGQAISDITERDYL